MPKIPTNAYKSGMPCILYTPRYGSIKGRIGTVGDCLATTRCNVFRDKRCPGLIVSVETETLEFRDSIRKHDLWCITAVHPSDPINKGEED